MNSRDIGGSLIKPSISHATSFRHLLHDEALRGQAKDWDLPFDAPDLILHKHIRELDHTHYWWLDQETLIGRIRLRDKTDGDFYETRGDVGYEVRPTFQRRGYATLMLDNLLKEAKHLGRQHLLITCSPGNVASRRVIEKNGGKLRDLYEREFLRFDFQLG